MPNGAISRSDKRVEGRRGGGRIANFDRCPLPAAETSYCSNLNLDRPATSSFRINLFVTSPVYYQEVQHAVKSSAHFITAKKRIPDWSFMRILDEQKLLVRKIIYISCKALLLIMNSSLFGLLQFMYGQITVIKRSQLEK